MNRATHPPPAAHARALYCPECQYDLRGRAGPRCPECGLDLAFVEADTSLIPWCDRSRPRLAAFAHTVWLANFRPRLLLREFYRPVDERAAQRFRWVCVAIAYLSLLAAAAVVYAIEPAGYADLVEATAPWFPASFVPAVLLAVVLWTGIPSYFFHPPWLPVALQNRAVALSYYASASLVFLALLPPAFAGVLLFKHPIDRVVIAIGVAAVLLLLILGHSCSLWAMFGRILLGQLRRKVVMYFLLPLLLAVSTVACLIGVPAVVYYVALIFYSLD